MEGNEKSGLAWVFGLGLVPGPKAETQDRNLVSATGVASYNWCTIPAMCGRFTLRAPASVIAEQFALFEVPPFTARFNIAPTQPVPVIRMGTDRLDPSTEEGNRELVWLRWGLVPGWAKDPAIGTG